MWSSDPFERAGQQAASARRQADRDAAVDRDIAERQEARRALIQWAQARGLRIVYRPTGDGSLIPVALPKGAPDTAPGFSAVPGDVRR